MFMSDGRKTRRLNRLQLLEIMYEQEQQIKKLEEKNNYLKNYIKKQSIELKGQKEIINLLSKLGKNPMGLNLDNTLTVKSNERLNLRDDCIVVPQDVICDMPRLRDNG